MTLILRFGITVGNLFRTAEKKNILKFKRKCFCLLQDLEWSAAVLFQDHIFSSRGLLFFFGVVVIKMQESTRKPQAHDLNGGDIHPCHWTESL